MKDIIILGAGGAGMDLISTIHAINRINPLWNILGYLDDNPSILGKSVIGYQILGTIDECIKYPNAFFISSIAHPKNRELRRTIFERVTKHGLKFATLIHPNVTIFEDVEIGEGSVIRANSLLGSGAKLGKNVSVSTGCMVNHEVIVGDHTTMSSGVVIASGVYIGTDVYIGCGVRTAHDIKIESDIVIGVGAAVISNIDNKISDTWVGVPAKPIIPKKIRVNNSQKT